MKPKFFQMGLFAVMVGSANSTPITPDGVNMGGSVSYPNTVASGSYSIASGGANEVTFSSIAFGDFNVAANYGLALGYDNEVSGGSLAVGGSNTADVDTYYSLLAGDSNYSGSNYGAVLLGVAGGMGNQEGSAVIGHSNKIYSNTGRYGSGNVLIGQMNRIQQHLPAADASIQGSVLIGSDNETVSTMSYAFGRGNIAQTDTVTLGTYAQEVSSAALIVGKGTSSSARSNGLVVLKNGEVQIAGSLVVGGSPVLSQSSAPSYLSTNGYLKKLSGTGASIGSSGYLAMGNSANASGAQSLAIGPSAVASNTATIALGSESQATGAYSVALQGGIAEGDHAFSASYGFASGDFSISMGSGAAWGNSSIAIGGFSSTYGWANEAGQVGATAIGGEMNQAWGKYSYAMGWNSASLGDHSYSIGYLTRTCGYQVSMGSKNLSANNLLPHLDNVNWVENGPLFELGNGNPTSSTDYSNAITTLKNGQTTLTNKQWKAHPSEPLEDPASTTDSGGNALVVDGHTVLNGKVTIAVPQGDISMGDYE